MNWPLAYVLDLSFEQIDAIDSLLNDEAFYRQAAQVAADAMRGRR